MKLTQAYIRKLIMEELLNEQEPQSPQSPQSTLDKNLATFITNSSSELKKATNEEQTLQILKKIISALPFNRMHVSRALTTLSKEMSVQSKAEPTAQPPVAKGITK